MYACVCSCFLVRSCRERISRLLLMFADEQREVQSMTEGNIAVAVGLKHVSSLQPPSVFIVLMSPFTYGSCVCVCVYSMLQASYPGHA